MYVADAAADASTRVHDDDDDGGTAVGGFCCEYVTLNTFLA